METKGSTDIEFSRQRYLNGSDSTELHTVDIWDIDPVSSAKDGKLWLIYVHGGGWRDPATDSSGFGPAVKDLLSSSVKDEIAGFASINYRLSPYPAHPDNPSSPDDPSRNVHYPSHLQDVGHALLYLDEKYMIANRYILIGHSAGATMALELRKQQFTQKFPLPSAILAVAGIYNFEAFLEAHSTIPIYREFMENAFPDRSQWESAGPYTNRSSEPPVWEHVKAVIISHSDEDQLVEKKQASFMLERARSISHIRDKVHFLKATGNHDEIWESGNILAGLISRSLELLRASS